VATSKAARTVAVQDVIAEPSGQQSVGGAPELLDLRATAGSALNRCGVQTGRRAVI